MGAPLFLQSRQVAEILGIKTTTLADWRRRGWIPYIRKGGDLMGRGGSVYYRRADVLAAMNSEGVGQSPAGLAVDAGGPR